MTNAEKIRAMTNEQLSDFLCAVAEGENCPKNAMLNWLNQEADTDD